jgi:hypothetical protein
MTTPGNDYLLDPAVQAHLAAHDGELITISVPKRFPGQPQPPDQFDFNRSKEVELLSGYLNGFTDIDYRDGNVTVDDAAQAVYGTVDEYLANRIALTHLKADSAFNKAQMNGQVTIVGMDGQRIIRDSRRRVVEALVREKTDAFQHAMTKKAHTAAKPVNAAIRKAGRIAPGSEADMKAIAREAADNAAHEQYLALGQGE